MFNKIVPSNNEPKKKQNIFKYIFSFIKIE